MRLPHVPCNSGFAFAAPVQRGGRPHGLTAFSFQGFPGAKEIMRRRIMFLIFPEAQPATLSL